MWFLNWLWKTEVSDSSESMERLAELDRQFDNSIKALTRVADSLSTEATKTNEVLQRKLDFVEKKMAVISDMVEDLIIVKTVNKQWVSINATACKLFGITSSECIGKTNEQLSAEFPSLRDFIGTLDGVERMSWEKRMPERIKCVYNSANCGIVDLDVRVAPVEGEDESQKEIIVVGKITSNYI